MENPKIKTLEERQAEFKTKARVIEPDIIFGYDYTPIEAINHVIKKASERVDQKLDTNPISDGYHTFGELYEHRITNFIALCKILSEKEVEYYRNDKYLVWRTKPVEGWFILGIGREKGQQITYHLPDSKYELVKNIAILMTPLGENFDGHTSQDVLDRLARL